MGKNIHGGGSKTNLNGLKFEQETSLENAILSFPHFTIKNNNLYFNEKHIGVLAGKHALYKKLLEPRGIDYTKIISKKLLPDDALYLKNSNTIFIIEKKFQNGAGSVDEKLQTCLFKKRQYLKLFTPLQIKVEYLYVLNNWFKKPSYKDVLDFIEESECFYFFNEIPLDFLGLTNYN